MTNTADGRSDFDYSLGALPRLLRERDQLLLLHEALADVERARTLDERLDVLVRAMRRLGYGRVEAIRNYALPAGVGVVAMISNSEYLDSDELIVPLRVVDGATVATLVLGEPAEAGPPSLVGVRTVELFAQQVASIIDNARLYDEAKAAADRYRQAVEDERRARDAVAQSEARYRNLFETASDAIYTLDPSGSFSSVNEATCELTGRSREDLLGRSPLPLITPSEVADVKEHFKSALAGTPRRYECHFVRPDGCRRLASVTNTPIRHGTQVIGILGVARDITDDRERAQALERSEARYARLVESASDAIITLDADGMLLSLNRSLERATGKFRDLLMGRAFSGLLDPRDQASYAQALRDTLAGARRRVELRYFAAGGETRLCSLRLTPLAEEATVTSALGIMRDVTDERRMTEQLIQQEKLAAVGQLVSGVAHELNNPLASVMAFAQLLLAAPAGSLHDARAIDAINQEAKRAARIVSNLLTFARQHQPERTVTDLNRVIEDTLELRRYALRVAHVDVETELAADLPVTWADPFQLQQVVLNLLVNAEHAMQSWDGPRRIALSTTRDGDQLVLCVADSGPGISPEHLSRIFNPFFTTKPVGEGTGLGLSISDGIVREHGGRIRVESQPGAGARFTIELPYVPPPAMEPATDAAAPPAPAAVRRLLVVDDESTIRNAISTYFRSIGHHVDLAASGQEALARAAAAVYDVLLIDLRLPDLSGDEVLRELELRGRVPRRVVFVTGDTQSESAREALESTGRPVVAKPFLLDELAAVALAEAEG